MKFSNGILRIEALNPQVYTQWRMTRFEKAKDRVALHNGNLCVEWLSLPGHARACFGDAVSWSVSWLDRSSLRLSRYA